MKIEAYIAHDAGDWQLDRVRLMLREERPGSVRFLMADGSWKEFSDEEPLGVLRDPEPGLFLPEQAIEPLAQAIAKYQGHASHADTEAHVLRESLEVERRRVDGLLERIEPALLTREAGA